MTLGDTRRITPLVLTPFSERNGVVAPDGRWLAYESNVRAVSNIRPAISRDTGRTLAGVHERRNATEMGAEQPPTGAVLCLPVRGHHGRARGGRILVDRNHADNGRE